MGHPAKIWIFGLALGPARDKEHEKLGISGLGIEFWALGLRLTGLAVHGLHLARARKLAF